MNLRALVLLLALANLALFAWTQGAFNAIAGLRVHADREPERLSRQIQPETLRILPPGEGAAAMAASAPTGATSCIEAGPFSPAEAGAAEAIVQSALPAGSWARRSVEQTAAEAAPMVALRIERADAALLALVARLGGEVGGRPLSKAFGPCPG